MSPDITPTNDSPIFTFNEFINVDIFAGITIFASICILLALNVFAIFIMCLSWVYIVYAVWILSHCFDVL